MSALGEVARACGRPIKRALEAMIDNRLVDFHMPPTMHGDLLVTFDDGPHPDYTPRLLDLLDEYDVRALFFVIGDRAEERPDLVQAYHERGHVVANHTYTHLNDSKGGRYSRSQVAEDINRCCDLVRRVTGRATDQFRPPRGELNTKTWGAARDTGHRLMLWSIEGGEWGRRKHWPAAEISAYITKNVQKRDILLLHDDNEKSLVVMSDFLKIMKRKKFDLFSGVTSMR
jgi:peptidoglycan-N-acetylglucosamine deacetylase